MDHAILYYDRSMDPYIRMGEKFVKISFLNEKRTSDIYQSTYTNHVQIFVWYQIWVLTESGQNSKNIFEICQDSVQIDIWFSSGPDREQIFVWTGSGQNSKIFF